MVLHGTAPPFFFKTTISEKPASDSHPLASLPDSTSQFKQSGYASVTSSAQCLRNTTMSFLEIYVMFHNTDATKISFFFFSLQTFDNVSFGMEAERPPTL